MPEIFISYRRNDSEGWAGRLTETLQLAFGEESVFFDFDSITPSSEWRHALEKGIISCKLLVAIIGPCWSKAMHPSGGLRLDDPDDLVRFELVTALEKGIAILPVLVGNASLPKATELPDVLQRILAFQALVLPSRHWKHEVGSILDIIEELLGRRRAQTPHSLSATKVGEKLRLEDVDAGDFAGVKGTKVPDNLGEVEVAKEAYIQRSKLKDIVGLKITDKGN
ncbi:toll/interleukin-1 receptor domain-containing protein [Candidatus Nitrospira salsa]